MPGRNTNLENWRGSSESQRSTGGYVVGDPSTEVVGRKQPSPMLSRPFNGQDGLDDTSYWGGNVALDTAQDYCTGSRCEDDAQVYRDGLTNAVLNRDRKNYRR